MLTPAEKLALVNRAVQKKKAEINAIDFWNPTYQVLHHMVKKGKLNTGFPDFEKRLLSKTLDYRTKKQIHGLQKNWSKQKYKSQRCLYCHIEVPGDQQTMIWHLRTHFANYTEHRNRIEQLETHPYQYV